MQNDQIYSSFTDLVSTSDDYNLLNMELELLEESLFETKTDFEYVLLHKVRKETSDLISKLIVNQKKEVVLRGLKKELAKIKFMEVSVAFDPSIEVTERIASFVKKNSKQSLAIDIKVDPKLIGGALVSFEGRFFDGSVLKKLNETLMNYV